MATEGFSFEHVRADELQQMKRADSNLAGLALSGGGIRSATFNLGVLQALAKHRLLSRFDYLSTVSGGGYIGSWLSGWIARKHHNVKRVEKMLGGAREPHEVAFLREYSNYLTPHVGWLGLDTLTMGATYVRNLLLNLTILVSWFGLFMLAPWALGWFGASTDAAYLLTGAVSFLAIAVFVVILNVAWQEVDENLKPPYRAKRRRRRSRNAAARAVRLLAVLLRKRLSLANRIRLRPVRAAPSPAQIIVIAIALPIVLWAYFLAMALHTRPDLFRLDSWIWTAYAASVGATAIRRVLLAHFARGRDVEEIIGTIRRDGALVLGTFAGIALVGIYASVAKGAASWHVLVWGMPAMTAVFLLSATVIVGLSGRAESEYAREWWSRLGGLLFRVMLVWIVIVGAAVYGPLIAAQLSGWAAAHLSLAWIATTIASVLAGKSSATGQDRSGKWLDLIAKIGPYVFIAGLVLAVASGLYFAFVDVPWKFWDVEEYFAELDHIDAAHVAEVAVGLLVLAWLVSWTVDVNLFSFHMFYRNRLARCYLGATRTHSRRVLPFIDFDPRDNPKLSELRERPYHLLNTAMNLTSSKRLGWQERKAASFVMTRDYCGYEFPKVGPSGESVRACFQPTAEYARSWKGSLNLGTALAISGAAANPNMGYHSSPSVAFLLTVFNVRLGWWMQNTSRPALWQAAGPHFGLWYLLLELFGLSNEQSGFVQLSDGGHFDNLGLYELVRRRCRFIVVVDAGADAKFEFEDLGNAIRKSMIDHGVDIRIAKRGLMPDPKSGQSLYHCAVGTIHYDRASPPGYLLYIKTSLTGNEPSDVAQYAAAHPAFPHESTSDQFFSESQFESYRKLGFHIADAVLEDSVRRATDRTALDMESLFVALKERWVPPASGKEVFARHGNRFSQLQDTLRSDPRLAFLDSQTYPEWDTLVAGHVGPSGPASAAGAPSLWLPPDAEQLHAGFHFCNSVLQLMENVYIELNLQQEHDHPDNRGWMNLFRHWSWSGMFQVTYAVSCSMYGARFQTFCERHLKLRPGSVQIERCATEEGLGKLNFVEKEIVQNLNAGGVACDTLWLLQTVVQSPDEFDRSKTENAFVYTFGFCLTRDDAIVYFRVQDHVRKMGNARRALMALFIERRWRNETVSAKPHTTWLEPYDAAGFGRLFDSVQQQRRYERRRR